MRKINLLCFACSLILAISFFSCSSSSDDDEEELTTGIGITFNLSNAKALAGQEAGSNRSARALSESSNLVKILENGSVESAIKVPSGMELAPVNAVFQSPASSDIYILFSNNTWYNHEDENGKWVNDGISQLICVHEDGSYDDILGFEPNNNSWKNIWAYNGNDFASCLQFDSYGNLYYMCYESSGNNGSSVFYRYNPVTKENRQLTAAVSSYSYRKFTVSKDGSYIFVEGWVNGNNNSEQFLRAIPVADPNNPRNIVYGSWNFSWVYDDYTNALYLCESNSENGGISKFTAESGFATKQWVARNSETTYIFTMNDGSTLTMGYSEVYPRNGSSNWPSDYRDVRTIESVYYDYQNLTATAGGIWGAKSEWYGGSTIYHVYKVLDANRTYCGVQYELPTGYGLKSFISTSSDLFVLADIMSGTSKTGYHTMFRIPSTGGQYTNIFSSVPNNTTTELISWSVSSDASTVFFSGVRGLTITNGKIATANNSYSTISSGTKFTCITALY